MSVRLPTDEDGLGGRECPSGSCSPGYFKVKPGTGITGGQTQAFCPYCRHADDPNGFYTQEQVRYIKDLIFRELHQNVGKMLGDALDLGPSGKKTVGGGFLSMELSYKQGSPPHVHRPFEEELRRDLTCPHCGLVHSVFGLATWCPDCGRDIFMVHVGKEFEVIRAMLGDVDRRRKELGHRVAARDIENALEDTVSIFEAVLRALTRRHLKGTGSSDQQVEEVMSKKVGNRFQNVELAAVVMKELAGVELFDGFDQGTRDSLNLTFAKRHPITHNLGVIDRKYLDKARHGGLEGREIRVGAVEVDGAIGTCVKVLGHLHERLFPDTAVRTLSAGPTSVAGGAQNDGDQMTGIPPPPG